MNSPRSYVGGGVWQRLVDNRVAIGFWREHAQPVLKLQGRSLAAVSDIRSKDGDTVLVLGKVNTLQKDVRPQLGSRGLIRSVSRPYRESESDKGDNSANDSEPNLNPCRYFLPLSGCSGSVRSISSFSLGGQVGGLVISGVLFAFLGVGGLFWGFDNHNGKWRRWAIGNAIACLGGLTFLYCWAFYAHPLLGMGW